MALLIGKPAPDFTAKAVVGTGDFTEIKLSEYAAAGKWTVLYFYPLDFTFVCPTEIRAFDELAPKFEAVNAQVIGCSVDSKFSHQAWLQSGTLIKDKTLRHPIIEDLTKNISRDYGVLNEAAGIAMRGVFIIDPKGNIRSYTVNDAPIGRNADEILRTLQAVQHVESNAGEVCPASWTPGAETIKVG